MFKRYKWIIVAVCMAVLLVMAMPAATAQNCESGGFYCLVAYLDTNGHVNEALWNGFVFPGAWGNTDITTAAGGISAANNSAMTGWLTGHTTQALYYEGSNQHIYQLYDNNGTWNNGDLTAATGNTLAASGTALTIVLRPGSSWALFYIGTNQHIYQLYWNGSSLSNGDVTAAAGGPVAATGSGLASFTTSGAGYAVLYVGTDQHVHQIYWTGSAWSNGDVTASAGAPLAATNSSLALFGAHNPSYAVFNIGANQHVYQLYWTGRFWTSGDVTAASGGPLAVSGSALTDLGTTSPNYAAFHFATNGDLNQLFWNGSSWSSGDLTAATGAPPAANGSGLASIAGSSYSLFYIGSTQNVYQIAWNGALSSGNITSAASGHVTATDSPLLVFVTQQ
jgi:hypothetical protein